MPYETPNGCVYDSGDYARCLDIALELVDADRLEERRRDAEARGKLLGFGIGSTLDSGTNNFGQSRLLNPELQFSGNNEVAMVKLDIFGEVVVTLGTTPQGQGHETTAAQVVADILGCDAGRRDRACRARLLLELPCGLLGDLREPVRGDGARRGEGRGRGAGRREIKRLAAVDPGRRRPGRDRPRGTGSRSGRTTRRRRSRSSRCGAIVNANNAGLPPRARRRHAELPLRLPAARSRCRTSSASSAT